MINALPKPNAPAGAASPAPAKNPFNMSEMFGALTAKPNTKNAAAALKKSVKGLNRRLMNSRKAVNAVRSAQRNLNRATRRAVKAMQPTNGGNVRPTNA